MLLLPVKKNNNKDLKLIVTEILISFLNTKRGKIFVKEYNTIFFKK